MVRLGGRFEGRARVKAALDLQFLPDFSAGSGPLSVAQRGESGVFMANFTV